MADQDFAVIIGIGRYKELGTNLPDAVRAALAMRSWLLDAVKVPPENMILLLEPADDAQAINGLGAREATFENITWAIDEIVRMSGGGGDRLFFYYSGHGFSIWNTSSFDDVIVHSDYVVRRAAPYGVESLKTHYAGVAFTNQIFILDSCRNVNPDVTQLSPLESDCQKDPSRCSDKINQFNWFATGPFMEANDFKGAFTDKLLDGLNGCAGCS